jgi:hypothetical protein
MYVILFFLGKTDGQTMESESGGGYGYDPICPSVFCPGRGFESNRKPLNPNPCHRNDTTCKEPCPNPHLCVGPVQEAAPSEGEFTMGGLVAT